ncbi:hypothetical protein PENSUB_6684 [Penicillium subrubescens]|uniref:Uncharacterized protein n=1 Tax=Penicillium subrubescens TaxID=1316194 RepID=A0A1Q5U0H9_9EURO|nr:hypothetical protein PENSUB_6684 [Penicillium subrubescens]
MQESVGSRADAGPIGAIGGYQVLVFTGGYWLSIPETPLLNMRASRRQQDSSQFRLYGMASQKLVCRK